MSETENTAESTVDNSVAQPAAEEKPKVRRTRTRKADAEDTSDSPKAEPEGREVECRTDTDEGSTEGQHPL